jgi:hypothetical protein
MKLELTMHDEKYTVESDVDGQDIHEMMQFISQLLLASGYHPNAVRDGFMGKVEEYDVE